VDLPSAMGNDNDRDDVEELRNDPKSLGQRAVE